jgi:hypothetical protein
MQRADTSSQKTAAAFLVAVATVVSLGGALSAARIHPPHNDGLLHGQMVARALAALQDSGWAAFQDPWFPLLNGGYPLFHHYPHLPHQWTAAGAWLFGLDAWTALSAAGLLMVLLLPVAVWRGGRILGLSPLAAGMAALVVATTRCVDGFGHAPLEYGFSGHGLYGQLWGMTFAAVALPAWVAACTREGAGLKRIPGWGRVLLASVLVSLVVRSSLPAGYLLGICSGAVVLAAGPARELPRRLALFAAVGAAATLLSLGFLVPFIQDIGATNSTVLELIPERRDSVGAVLVLKRLLSGFYLDGGVPGPWSLLLAVTSTGVLVAWVARRPVPPVLAGLALALLVSVLLLFGRATWGQWLDDLPLLGRFHDHRYLLGVHLVAPWIIGAGLAALAGRIAEVRGPAVAVLPLVLAGGVATWLQVADATDGRRFYDQTLPTFDAAEPGLQELVEEARLLDGARAALSGPDVVVGGTTRLSWLRRQGLSTFGRPLYHYSHVHDFALYWTRWVAGQEGRDRPVAVADLAAAGVGQLLDGRGSSFPGAVVPDTALVRSDLLVRVDGSDLEGIAIRWFSEGLHLARQFPTLDLGVGAPPDPARYARTTELADRDVSALQGLPEASQLGRVLSSVQGERPGDRLVRARVEPEEAWLLVTTSWHPRWTVLVDGEPAVAHMLIPGWTGVPLSRGEHEVALRWRPAPWRGPYAAGNALAILLSLILVAWLALRPARADDREAPRG